MCGGCDFRVSLVHYLSDWAPQSNIQVHTHTHTPIRKPIQIPTGRTRAHCPQRPTIRSVATIDQPPDANAAAATTAVAFTDLHVVVGRRLRQTLDDALAKLSKLFVPRFEAAVVAGRRRTGWRRFTGTYDHSRPLPRAPEEGQLEPAAATARRVLSHHGERCAMGGREEEMTETASSRATQVEPPRESILGGGAEGTQKNSPAVSFRLCAK